MMIRRKKIYLSAAVATFLKARGECSGRLNKDFQPVNAWSRDQESFTGFARVTCDNFDPSVGH